MELKIGEEISGIDVYGSNVKGTVTGISNILKIATVKIGEDILDTTTINFNDINKY